MSTPNPGVRGPFHCQVPKLLPASPDRVYKAWTDEKEATAWLANGGRAILQPHVDGLFFIDMVYLEHTYPHYGRYLATEPGKRLEFTWVSQGTEGKESIVEVTFTPHSDGTMLTLTHRGLPSEESANQHTGGWSEILDVLATSV